jgi:hypothetical protein
MIIDFRTRKETNESELQSKNARSQLAVDLASQEIQGLLEKIKNGNAGFVFLLVETDKNGDPVPHLVYHKQPIDNEVWDALLFAVSEMQ